MVVVSGLVVVVGGFVVVVVDGFGTRVVVVVAALAPDAPSTPRRGPHTMTAIPARAILFGYVNPSRINSPRCVCQHRRTADCTHLAVRTGALGESDSLGTSSDAKAPE